MSLSDKVWGLRGGLSAVSVFAGVLIAGALFFPAAIAADRPASSLVLELRISGEVEPILATYIDEGIEDAANRNASLILITMDTPGGLSSSMQDIIQHILTSKVPVAVYVSPTGARGASAGFYILLAADIAAMAPATHTGAASPVVLIGGYQLQIDETMRKKIMNDATAFLRSYSEKRGRNAALAETAVTDAKAFTEKEALDGKLIDVVASSKEDLLRQLDGREVKRFDGTQNKLALAGASRELFELSGRQKFLARIVEPDIFFVLLIIGVLGLYTEFTHPGMVAPGVIGGICAVLALYAMHILPVNLAGVLLIFLALALFILEAKFASHGVLAVGGIISMLLGAMFLIRSPLTGGGVSFGIALATTLPCALITVFLMRLVLRSRQWKSTTGREELIGAQGVVVSAAASGTEGMSIAGAYEMMIRVHGELWRAASARPVAQGMAVRVLRVEGLQLFVEPTEAVGVAAK
ncbi:MAG TPA: nodulation protein NfeD [Candidatus Acidoferrum sp.]|jgi:membrane-bound serine protease (ClpP class)